MQKDHPPFDRLWQVGVCDNHSVQLATFSMWREGQGSPSCISCQSAHDNEGNRPQYVKLEAGLTSPVFKASIDVPVVGPGAVGRFTMTIRPSDAVNARFGRDMEYVDLEHLLVK